MIKDKLIKLIQVNKISEALDYLMLITKSNDKKSYNQLIALAARLNANSGLFNQGLLDYKQLKIENSKIYYASIQLIDAISSEAYFKNIQLDDLKKQAEAGTEEKVKILFVASNPIGTAKFQLEKEYLEIRRIFRPKRTKFEVTELFNSTLDDLLEAVQREKPDILHIAAPSTDKYLILHRPDDTVRSVSYHILASIFILFQPYVKCVFMNTRCSSIFLKKISNALQCAIGSKNLVNDNVSVLFSSGFYTAIAEGKTFDKAFSVGVELLRKQNIADAEIPFILFNCGLSNDPNDNTPEDFNFQEPEEIVRLLNMV